jgi:hypothetical protein
MGHLILRQLEARLTTIIQHLGTSELLEEGTKKEFSIFWPAPQEVDDILAKKDTPEVGLLLP